MKKKRTLIYAYASALVLSFISLLILFRLDRSGNYTGFMVMFGVWMEINLITCSILTIAFVFIERLIKPEAIDTSQIKFWFLAFLPIVTSVQIIISAIIMQGASYDLGVFHVLNYAFLALILIIVYLFKDNFFTSKFLKFFKYFIFFVFWFIQIEFAIS